MWEVAKRVVRRDADGQVGPPVRLSWTGMSAYIPPKYVYVRIQDTVCVFIQVAGEYPSSVCLFDPTYTRPGVRS